MTAQNDKAGDTTGDLLIIHPGALGDVVVMFALVAELRNRYRRITLICRPSVGYLALRLNLVNRSLSHEAGFWSTLFTQSPDLRVIQLLNEHGQIIAFSINPEIEDIIRTHSRVPCLRLPPRPPVHQADHVAGFAAKQLIEKGLINHRPSFRRAVCRSSEDEPERPINLLSAPVLLHPGAGSPRKRWPVEKFLEVASRIESAGRMPEFIIGPAEMDLVEKSLPPGLTLHVLREIEDLLHLLQSAAGFIGNDSGVAHLAACLGLPTTVIYTVSDARRWRPNGPAVSTLAPMLTCRPCFEIQKENCPQPDCMESITPDMVLESFNRLTEIQEKK
jgi:ADP-heptose:LPS heptosyltransferase